MSEQKAMTAQRLAELHEYRRRLVEAGKGFGVEVLAECLAEIERLVPQERLRQEQAQCEEWKRAAQSWRKQAEQAQIEIERVEKERDDLQNSQGLLRELTSADVSGILKLIGEKEALRKNLAAVEQDRLKLRKDVQDLQQALARPLQDVALEAENAVLVNQIERWKEQNARDMQWWQEMAGELGASGRPYPQLVARARELAGNLYKVERQRDYAKRMLDMVTTALGRDHVVL